MRSGHCSNGDTGHARCRMASCSCPQHDADTLARSAALTETPTVEASELDPVAILNTLSEAAADLSEAVTAVLDPEAALLILHRLRGILATLGQVDAHLVTTAYLYGEHGDVRVEGLPPAKVTRGRERKAWDSRGAAFAYVDRKIRAAGGVTPDPSEVAAWVLDVIGASYCKVTPLRDVGLDPTDFCTESPGRLGVQFLE